MIRLHVVAAAILEGGRVLAARRSASMREPLKWEFPGGKIEQGESAADALARELLEELCVEVEVGPPLGTSETPELELRLFSCRIRSGALLAREHAELRWLGAHELRSLDWAPADVPLLECVARVLTEAGGQR